MLKVLRPIVKQRRCQERSSRKPDNYSPFKTSAKNPDLEQLHDLAGNPKQQLFLRKWRPATKNLPLFFQLCHLSFTTEEVSLGEVGGGGEEVGRKVWEG